MMSYTSDCRPRWCYEWVVERPVESRPRNSPSFIHNGTEVHFQLSVCSKVYTMHVKPDCFGYDNVFVHVEDRNGSVLPLSYRPYNCNYPNAIWKYEESKILKAIPDFHSNGLLKFLVTIKDPSLTEFVIAPGTAPNPELAEKAIQTSEYKNALPCLESLSEDFSRLLEKGPKPDVEMTCGDLKIKAHGLVLSNRSEVFAAMLNNDLSESRTGKVTIEDMDQEVFGHFVRYLYTGQLAELTVDSAKRFYEAADKYAVKGLMRRCASFLKENLDPENACEMLVLADAHSDPGFKESVTGYIVQEEIHLLQDERWLAFCKTQPILATEVLNLYCKHQRNK